MRSLLVSNDSESAEKAEKAEKLVSWEERALRRPRRANKKRKVATSLAFVN